MHASGIELRCMRSNKRSKEWKQLPDEGIEPWFMRYKALQVNKINWNKCAREGSNRGAHGSRRIPKRCRFNKASFNKARKQMKKKKVTWQGFELVTWTFKALIQWTLSACTRWPKQYFRSSSPAVFRWSFINFFQNLAWYTWIDSSHHQEQGSNINSG